MAKDLNVSEGTIRNTVPGLGLKSYKKRKRQKLTQTTIETRLAKAKKLLNWIKSHASIVRIFSDKKLWTVDLAHNNQNERCLAFSREDVPAVLTTKHPASAMMLGVVASDGKRMPPYWTAQNVKITADIYLDIMQTGQALAGHELP